MLRINIISKSLVIIIYQRRCAVFWSYQFFFFGKSYEQSRVCKSKLRNKHSNIFIWKRLSKYEQAKLFQF